MKEKFTFLITLLLITSMAYSQTITFSSNGYKSSFTKIDTLHYTEYEGIKPSTKNPNIDSSLSISLIQTNNFFGVTTNSNNSKSIDNKFQSWKKHFSTNYYRYEDGTLEAPTSTIFFKLKDSSQLANIAKFGNIVKDTTFPNSYYLEANTQILKNGELIFKLCDRLYNEGIVSVAEPVFIRRIQVNNDPLLPNEWNINNIGQYNGTPGADMKVSDVWSLGYSGSGVKVAVIDVGVDLTHPDLQANLLPGYDGTGNGSAGAPQYNDHNTHGTNCAGIISEIKNSIGGVGVAYNAKIIPIRLGIADSNGSIAVTDNILVNCFNFAKNNGADIITNSYTWGSPSSQLNQAINDNIINGRNGKGALVLFAAGNFNSSITAIAAANSNIIAVGASTECDTRKRSSDNPLLLNDDVSPDPLGVSCDGEFWWGSNYGTGLDLMAPGVNITTTSFSAISGGGHNDTYMTDFNGTSSASPNTAAVLALMLSANPNLTGTQARQMLEGACDKVGGYTYQSGISGQPNGTWCTDAGYGRVNAFAAVARALNIVISGPDYMCSSATYTLSNVPSGVTVTWSISQTGVFNINPSGSSVLVSNVGSGSATLTASINGNEVARKEISNTPTILSVNSSLYGTCTSTAWQEWYLEVDIVNGTFDGWQVASTSGGAQVNIYGANWVSISKGSASLNFTYHDACGNHYTAGGPTIYKPCASTTLATTAPLYLLSPNPAVNSININPIKPSIGLSLKKTAKDYSMIKVAPKSTEITRVNIYDQSGNRKQQKNFNKVRNARLNVSNFPNGIYFVELILNDGSKEKHAVIIKH